jgi:hypothetical protein
MEKLPPWANGPFELIRHAEEHLKTGTDFDRRMALISFDNAIEVAITVFLQLHPKQRKGVTFKGDDVQKWLANYHSKLEFLDQYVQSVKRPIESTVAEITWYHSLRNELYHSGNGLVPEQNYLQGARKAALEVFSLLFELDGKTILEEPMLCVLPVSVSEEPPRHYGSNLTKEILPHLERNRAQIRSWLLADNRTEGVDWLLDQVSAQTNFLHSFVTLERKLRVSMLVLGGSKDQQRTSVLGMWNFLASKIGGAPKEFDISIRQALTARNMIVHKGYSNQSELRLYDLAKRVDKLIRYIARYAELSLDLLPALRRRYGRWLIAGLQTLHFRINDEALFLEAILGEGSLCSGETRIVIGLREIWKRNTPFYLPNLTPEENAERFLDKLDLPSIVRNTFGRNLFTPQGLNEIQ